MDYISFLESTSLNIQLLIDNPECTLALCFPKHKEQTSRTLTSVSKLKNEIPLYNSFYILITKHITSVF